MAIRVIRPMSERLLIPDTHGADVVVHVRLKVVDTVDTSAEVI